MPCLLQEIRYPWMAEQLGMMPVMANDVRIEQLWIPDSLDGPDAAIGIHYADLATGGLDYEQKISYTFYWHDSETWENENYTLAIEKFRSAQVQASKEKRVRRPKMKVLLSA